MYELAILGGGPAGVAAGVYAARKKLKTVLITESFGGQSTESSGIQNWIGTIEIDGLAFSEMLKGHLLAYSDGIIDIKEGEKIESVGKTDASFEIKTNKNTHRAKNLLITTGSHRRKLEIPGAEEFENRGITYCASCDGPLFSGKDVVIIGGGNAGFETALQLLAHAKSVTLLHRSANFKADPITVEKVLSDPKMKALKNVLPVEIKGNKFVTEVVYENKDTKERTEIPAEGVFIEIGSVPNVDFVKDQLELNEYNQIKIDHRNQRTSAEGIWAAGDCTDALFHQNNIAAGDAVRALEDIYIHLHTR
ncbi:MAG: hypothetical protein A2653_02980 [Candidatus Zambryskibacteria bacterium RIFCSPHIGHO2_01_FULL_43_25]|uniref:FAD/NAD(P)-binding domain-containing protein n=1 Tax=Candidatus Zambryskibacteria bacterium RIFCSPLOWO2_01_FULL_45_21 TaxID=1802761 RepID=A0A1G2U244_9BACT|nr:MAG: hypothetical protein A2653_02980 [Candidatus Zambryskibacteria bacterium RIFCSPHIGHO2_01_FULL_43_25]OHB00942.1 MAG: hypothetical protein A3E94_00180 [Candidatus Zambryskibacteria bacterium RIFCSPHIGHO2_12_FULL_44_12b]OHB02970.1 MAG: hypothetical protein A3B14_00825 [Candidatus Zambryskibacteria bacterium RIFCSPLOWO2_01_FULL_45_21]